MYRSEGVDVLQRLKLYSWQPCELVLLLASTRRESFLLSDHGQPSHLSTRANRPRINQGELTRPMHPPKSPEEALV